MSVDVVSGSQVRTARPDGSNPIWLGEVGHVNQLVYAFVAPGGCDQMTCTLEIAATQRTPAMDPGRIVEVVRGASVVWRGQMQEPAPGTDGWAISAVGYGNLGTNYDAVYTGTWDTSGSLADDMINAAIVRGLPWVNHGIDGVSGLWYGQEVDPGAQTITDLLNLLCTYGGLIWYVDRNNVVQLVPLPTVANRILVCATPVPRTLGGDVNTLWLNYQSGTDSSGAATFGLAESQLPASVAQYGRLENYLDLSSATSSVTSSGAAQAIGNEVLARYNRASFGGPFQVMHGELLTTGGYPVDLGTEQALTVCRLMMTDYAYGGEVTPGPIEFIVGNYSYDDDAQMGTVTPLQTLDTSMSGLLSMISLTQP